MDVQLKHRIAGAVILISAAVIVVPLTLDGDPAERREFVRQAPPATAIDFEALALESLDVGEAHAQMDARAEASAARMPQETPDPTDYAALPSPALDQNRLPVGWSLQVGSFKNKANAGKLLAALRAEDHRAYVYKKSVWGTTRYRVYIGPMVDREALLAIGAAVEAQSGRKGVLVRYAIEEDADLITAGELQ